MPSGSPSVSARCSMLFSSLVPYGSDIIAWSKPVRPPGYGCRGLASTALPWEKESNTRSSSRASAGIIGLSYGNVAYVAPLVVGCLAIVLGLRILKCLKKPTMKSTDGTSSISTSKVSRDDYKNSFGFNLLNLITRGTLTTGPIGNRNAPPRTGSGLAPSDTERARPPKGKARTSEGREEDDRGHPMEGESGRWEE